MHFENCRAKGFTVIQAVALAELDGLNAPNRYGVKPMIDNNPYTPNEKYFEYMDWVIKKAAEKGLFIGLLPTWGNKVDKAWGTGLVIFNKDNAYKYGQWFANRYKNNTNIFWIDGGDRNPDSTINRHLGNQKSCCTIPGFIRRNRSNVSNSWTDKWIDHH